MSKRRLIINKNQLPDFGGQENDVAQSFVVTNRVDNLPKDIDTNIIILTGTAGNQILSGIANCVENQRITIINQTNGLIFIANEFYSLSANRFNFGISRRSFRLDLSSAATFIYLNGKVRPSDNSYEEVYSRGISSDISLVPYYGAFASITYANRKVNYKRSGKVAQLEITLSTSEITQGTATDSVTILITGGLENILYNPSLYGFASTFSKFTVRFNSGAPFINPPRIAEISYNGVYPSGALKISLFKASDPQDIGGATTPLTVSDLNYGTGTKNMILLSITIIY